MTSTTATANVNGPATAVSTPNGASSGQTQDKILPFEVGWMFVHEYYTFLNREPERLHCFYSKKSSMIRGIEGESVKQCHGQQEIQTKIKDLSFNNCKVRVSNVDCQPSTNGGIVIQVLGTMSNDGEVYKKFAQTFFLAEQPNGYYVLNDIFRYLKDAEEEEEEEEEVIEGDEEWEKVEGEREKEEVEPATAVVETPAKNDEKEVEEKEAEQKKEEEKEIEPKKEAEESKQEEKGTEEQKAPAQAPVAEVKPAQPAQPTQPAAPPAPKTWANLAARNVNQWGNNMATARGTTAPPPDAKQAQQKPQPSQQQQKQPAQDQKPTQPQQQQSQPRQQQPQQQQQQQQPSSEDEGFKTVQGQRQNRGRRYEEGEDKRRSGDFRGRGQDRRGFREGGRGNSFSGRGRGGDRGRGRGRGVDRPSQN
ncbi:uncharacterized protein VTP21DRAFT_11659 [Calcarisporiella thermophila]|uniref:uncharacterized protein n=1 Tax=Calcarisporiella thermophila TaxID=911321 RepID=UPI0037427D63